MSTRPLLFSLLLISCAYLACCDATFGFQQSKGGTFVNPVNGITHPEDYPDNPVYAAGDKLSISWTSSMSPVDVLLCQPDSGGFYSFNRLAQNAPIQSLTWQISAANLTSKPLGSMFFLAVFQSGSKGDYFTSHFFNISNSAPRAGASSTNAPAVIAAASPAASPSESPAASPAASPSAPPAASPAVSSAASPSTAAAASAATSSLQLVVAPGVVLAATAAATPVVTAVAIGTQGVEPAASSTNADASAGTPAATSGASSSAAAAQQQPGISVGAIAGIVAGVAVVLLVPTVLLAVLYHRQKVRAAATAAAAAGGGDDDHEKAAAAVVPIKAKSLGSASRSSVASSSEKSESSAEVSELDDGAASYHELDAGPAGVEAPARIFFKKPAGRRRQDSDMLNFQLNNI